MTTNWRALCAELTDALHNAIRVIHHEGGTLHISTAEPVLDRARTALAEPKPEGPTVMEIIELADEIEAAELGQVDLVRAALARWGHQPTPPAEGEQRHPEPVPVSERLPGAEDCDAEGRCWFFIDGAQWAIDGAHWALEDRTYGCNRHRSHWLPAHALPLPAGEVEP